MQSASRAARARVDAPGLSETNDFIDDESNVAERKHNGF